MALTRFAAGDPEPFRQLWSASADATYFGSSTGMLQGSDAIEARLEQISAEYAGCRMEVYTVASECSGDLAYAVQIEHLSGDGPAAGPTYRTTHVYRWEHGAWKIVHRHVDPLVESRARSIAAHPSSGQRPPTS